MNKENDDIENRSGLRIRLDEIIKRNKPAGVFAITVGGFSGYYQFNKGFHGLVDFSTIFQEKIDRTLEYSTPTCIDEITVVTRGDRVEHKMNLFDELKKIEDAGYRASEKRSEYFLNETKWLGNEIDENGIKPNKEKVKAITDLKHPEIQKQLKSFLGAIQNLAKIYRVPNGIEGKNKKMISITKKLLTEESCLAHYAKDRENIVITDASESGLGKTLWQKPSDGEKTDSRYLNESETNYSIRELVWGLEKFRFQLYGKKVSLYTYHQALETLI